MSIVGGTSATIEQDRASGGGEFRRLRLKNGEAVTASLKLSPVAPKAAQGEQIYRVSVRFSFGGTTMERSVGRVAGSTRFAALKAAWLSVRAGDALEAQGWKWVIPVTKDK